MMTMQALGETERPTALCTYDIGPAGGHRENRMSSTKQDMSGGEVGTRRQRPGDNPNEGQAAAGGRDSERTREERAALEGPP